MTIDEVFKHPWVVKFEKEALYKQAKLNENKSLVKNKFVSSVSLLPYNSKESKESVAKDTKENKMKDIKNNDILNAVPEQLEKVLEKVKQSELVDIAEQNFKRKNTTQTPIDDLVSKILTNEIS